LRYLVGLDDTDAGDSIGTGALARELGALLARDHGATLAGITRHQLLVHPDIPYTSHNSSACIELDCGVSAEALAATCRAFVGYLFHPGADPGLCVAAPADAAAGPVQEFGRRAQRDIVRKADAIALAAAHRISLAELGGTGLGVVGALAACGLRASGDDGRFLAIPGARQTSGELSVAELRAKVPIDVVLDETGRAVEPGCVIETRGWVRPELRGGRVVLQVERREGRCVVPRKKGGDADL
jgi:hypothetical protein